MLQDYQLPMSYTGGFKPQLQYKYIHYAQFPAVITHVVHQHTICIDPPSVTPLGRNE